ncbi:MAG: hypothetical protein ABSH53_05065 [Holophaga sp.]
MEVDKTFPPDTTRTYNLLEADTEDRFARDPRPQRMGRVRALPWEEGVQEV